MITVKKEWGTEYWLVNEPEYCMKILDIKPGKQCSLHFHPVKKETFIVQTGQVKVQRGSASVLDPLGKNIIIETLYPGQSVTIEPYTPHRFAAIGGSARIIEVSTHHDDKDVFRLKPSGDLEENW